MATITTRAGKGSPLTNTEVDDNFSNLNSAKYESGATPSFGSTILTTADTVNLTLDGASANSKNIYFKGDSSAQRGRIASVGTSLYFQLTDATNYFTINPGSTVINDSSVDHDFRVESNDNANMLFVDASTNRIGVGAGSPQKQLHLAGATGQYILLENYTNGLQAGDVSGGLLFMNGDDSTPSGDRITASIKAVAADAFGRQDLVFYTGHTNGKSAYGGAADYTDATVERLRITAYSGIIANDNGNDVDFRVESNDNANMLFVDASTNRIGVGTGAPLGDVQIVTATAGTVLNVNHNTGGSYPKASGIGLGATSTALTVASDGGTVSFTGGAGIYAENTAASGNPTNLVFWTNLAGTPDQALSIGGNNVATFASTVSTPTLASPDGTTIITLQNTGEASFPRSAVFNEAGIDSDFRVESNDNSNMLFVDGGTNRVGIGTFSQGPRTLLELQGSVMPETGDAASVEDMLNLYRNGSPSVWSGGATLALGRYSAGNGSAPKSRLDFKLKNAAGSNTALPETTVMSLQSQGSVGIGTTVPAERIHGHNGSGNDGTYLRLSGGGSLNESYGGWMRGYGVQGSGGYLELGVVDAGTLKTAMQVTAQGNNLKFFSAGTERLQFDHLGNTVFNEGGNDSDFRVESAGSSNAIFVDAGNNRVGILTNAPPLPLSQGERTGAALNYINGTANTISTDSGIFVSKTTTDEATVGFGLQLANNSNVADTRSPLIGFSALAASDGYNHTYAAIWGLKSGNGADTNWNTGQLHFGTSSGTGVNVRMKLTQVGGLVLNPALNGHAVFNEDSADADFRVETDSYSHAMFVDASSNNIVFGRETHSWSANNFHIASPVNGGIAITANGDWGLQMAGARAERIRFFSSAGGSSTVGNVSVNTTGTTYSTTSDRRLKKDIETITDGTDKLMAMNPVTHGWKADPEADPVHGFIAQEMMDIVPEAVIGDPEGEEMMSMDYGRITPVLVAALQDAHKKIAELETRLNELEGK